jgi:hypothetical protein
MIRDIEKVLGHKIEREHLDGFDYTSRPQQNRSQQDHPDQTHGHVSQSRPHRANFNHRRNSRQHKHVVENKAA